MQRHDERVVVRHAQDAAAASLRDHGAVLPGAVMLVLRDPHSEQPLSEPHAIGMMEPEPLADEEAMQSFLGGLRAEAQRLHARAVALVGEAGAEVEGGGSRRVALIRMEDATGVQLMHAPIEVRGGQPTLGDFVASPEAPDILEHPLLPTADAETDPDGRKRLPVVS